MFNAVVLTFTAGVLGTLLGGIVGLKFDPKSTKSFSLLLSFSAGMMIAMVCFDLMPHALHHSGLLITIFGVLLGFFLLILFDGKFHHHHEDEGAEIDDLHHHHLAIEKADSHKWVELGAMMIFSVALHNFPEGMAIGSSSIYDLNTGLMMAFLLALHNLPEGMGMIVPLRSGGISKGKALLLVALSGISTLVGGIVGALVGSIGMSVIGFTLALAAGCMLYVVYYEVLPQVGLMNKTRHPVIYQILGFMIGFIIISLTHTH